MCRYEGVRRGHCQQFVCSCCVLCTVRFVIAFLPSIVYCILCTVYCALHLVCCIPYIAHRLLITVLTIAYCIPPAAHLFTVNRRSQAPRDGLPISSWYPGDDVVDWCGVSIFTQPYACQLADKCQMPYAEDVASFCKARQKPLMIAESTPFGGIVSADGENEAGARGSSWNKWFVPVLSFINKVGRAVACRL
jgi:hypothetical protein